MEDIWHFLQDVTMATMIVVRYYGNVWGTFYTIPCHDNKSENETIGERYGNFLNNIFGHGNSTNTEALCECLMNYFQDLLS